VAVLIGRIAGLARPSDRLSRSSSKLEKRRRETEIGMKVPSRQE